MYTANPGLSNTSLRRHVRATSGVIMSTLQSWFYSPLLRTPSNAAQTIIFCAIDESLTDQTGYYYENCALAEPSEQSSSLFNAQELWKLTERHLGIS